MLSRRLAVAFALGTMLAAASLAACAIDPVPPHPHGDSGEEPDQLTNAVDGGAIDDGGQEAGL